MDQDALYAVGMSLAAIGGMLERKGVCTVDEMADTLCGLARMTMNSGFEYQGRASYIGSLAVMVKLAAEGMTDETLN